MITSTRRFEGKGAQRIPLGVLIAHHALTIDDRAVRRADLEAR
jgi:hypothetical protein